MEVDKKIPFNSGFLVSVLIVAVPAYAWKYGFTFSNLSAIEAVLISLAKIGAFGGTASFALALILSARYKWVDALFGGLDKVYIAHRIFGALGASLLLLHPIALSLYRLSSSSFVDSFKIWILPPDVGVLLGVLALYTMLGIVVWTIVAKVKYEIFLIVHRYLGVAFIIGAAHAFLSGSVLATSTFMYWYLLALSVVATLSFILYSILGDILHRPLKYRVAGVRDTNGIIELTLSPRFRALKFQPGQFVYVKFDEFTTHGYHPFSVASDTRSLQLVLAIRKSGDLTRLLSDAKLTGGVDVKGPYGGFILEPKTKQKQLWIAGGIGVTPFLSAAASLQHKGRHHGNDIEMIYATRDTEPYGLDQLQHIEEEKGLFNVTLVHSDTFGNINLQDVGQHITDFKDRLIYICGPKPMLEAFQAEAEELGIEDNLYYEEFSY